MIISELIDTLEYCKKTYGDIKLNLSMDAKPGEIITSEVIMTRYEQHEDHDELSITSFPY